MRRFNWFCGFGRFFGIIGVCYAVALKNRYGAELPKSTEEWLAELRRMCGDV